MTPLTADVCVMGAGPAGCVIAARLAQLGVAVRLVERETFPRPHLGESLSPGVLPLLETIGARGAVEAAGFTRVRRVLSNWDGPLAERVDSGEQGLLVDRGRFDALLSDRARALGAEVMQPAVVRQFAQEGEVWQLGVEAAGSVRHLRVRYLVDATGRAAALAGRRRRTGPRTVALYAYWNGRGLPDQPRIGAGPNEWYWGVPLPDGLYNTLVFMDGASSGGRTRQAREARFHETVNRAGLLDGCDDPRLAGRVQMMDATPYLDDECVTRAQMKIGDSVLALDPLSSSGVQKAIQTALSGAVVVNTLLHKPENTDTAVRFYRESLAQASARHRSWAAGHYATVAARERSPFWTERALSAGTPEPHVPSATREGLSAQIASLAAVRLSPDAVFIEVPRLGADFVALGPALRHPALAEPVAYLGGWELAPLLREVRPGMTTLQVVQSWAPGVPIESGLAIAGWMLGRGILVPQCQS